MHDQDVSENFFYNYAKPTIHPRPQHGFLQAIPSIQRGGTPQNEEIERWPSKSEQRIEKATEGQDTIQNGSISKMICFITHLKKQI